jgi:hypothetical protein
MCTTSLWVICGYGKPMLFPCTRSKIRGVLRHDEAPSQRELSICLSFAALLMLGSGNGPFYSLKRAFA